MKKLRVEIKQISNKEATIIYDSNVKIFVDDKEIKNNTKKVIETLINKNDGVKYRVVSKYKYIYVDVTYKSGQKVKYKMNYDEKFIDSTLDIKINKKKLEEIKNFILKIEKDVKDASSTEKMYIIEI